MCPSTNSVRCSKTFIHAYILIYLYILIKSFYLNYIGFLLYLHLQTVLDILIKIFKRYVLQGVLPRSDWILRNEIDLLEFISKTPFSMLIKQFITDLSFYIPGLFLTIFIPLKYGHFLCPMSKLIEFRFGEIVMDVQVPAEKIMFHILIPFITEKLKYYTILNVCFEFFFKHICRFLDLKDILDPFFLRFKGKIYKFIMHISMHILTYLSVFLNNH